MSNDTNGNKKTIIIACQLLKKELAFAMEKTGCNFDIIMLPQELHNSPEKLRNAIQNEFDKLVGVDRVIMTIGDCGGATKGLKTGNFELVFPKVEDCITLLLGSAKRRKELSHDGYYYLTESWVDGTRSVVAEYDYCLEKYDEDTALEIMEEMFKNYSKMGLIDTGASDYDYLQSKTKPLADLLEMKQEKLTGTCNWIEKLLTGPYNPEEFNVIAPNSIVE